MQFRAPTIEHPSLKPDENFPLCYEGWYLFGNGVIAATYLPTIRDDLNCNDLFYVLKRLVRFGWGYLEEVDGVFALVLLDPRQRVFLVRKDFPLHFSANLISSIPFDGGSAVPHGVVVGWDHDYEQRLQLRTVWA